MSHHWRSLPPAFAALMMLLAHAADARAAASAGFQPGPGPQGIRMAAARLVPLDELAERRGLRLVSDPGALRLEFAGAGVRLSLAANIDWVMVNGRSHRLPCAPQVSGGRLLVPDAIAELFGGGQAKGLVILDPGHGGKDDGAVANGIREKDVVLDVALRTADKLRQQGATVIMTRNDDDFVSLEKRSAIANQAAGAAFVSIHANALSRRDADWRNVHGIETFVLAGRVSESYRVAKASSRYDLQAPDAAGGEVLSPARERAAIAAISKEARAASLDLARAVQNGLVAATGDTDRQVRQMNLAVLRDTYFGPAILTEIGFLTHPATADRLKTAAYRDAIAQAIADGIAAFLTKIGTEP